MDPQESMYTLFRDIAADPMRGTRESAYCEIFGEILKEANEKGILLDMQYPVGNTIYTALQIACHEQLVDLALRLLDNFSPENLAINAPAGDPPQTALAMIDEIIQSPPAAASSNFMEKMNNLRKRLIERGARVEPEINELGSIVLLDEPSFRDSFRTLPGDKYIIADNLFRHLKSVSSRTDARAKGYIYAWEFFDAAPSDEINMVFLGTGNMPCFAEHTVISEGGDVLCHIAYQKGIHHHQPTLLVKGVGTAHLLESREEDKHYPIYSMMDPNSKYAGGGGGVGFGAGVDRRLKIAMEEFCIPHIMRLIHEGRQQMTVNIIGHSRGAITSFYMCDLIDLWIKHIESNYPIDEAALARVANLSLEDTQNVLRLIRENQVTIRLNLLGFDPVEGRFKIAQPLAAARQGVEGMLRGFMGFFRRAPNAESEGKIEPDTHLHVAIEGIGTLMPQCSVMPERVQRALIFLAEAERRLDFRPTLPFFQIVSEFYLRMQLGTHSTMTGNLGNDDGNGQDAYKALKHNKFVQEAALAFVDKVKIESNYFLFGRDNLPPLQRHILRTLLETERYPLAKQYISQYLIKARRSHPHLLRDKSDVECCEEMMRREPVLTKRVSFLIEKDIHDGYLYPMNPDHLTQLDAWQDEMKRDTSTVLTDPLTGKVYLSLKTSSPDVPREYYERGVSQEGYHTIVDRFPELMGNPFYLVPSDFVVPDGVDILSGPLQRLEFDNPRAQKRSTIILSVVDNVIDIDIKFSEILEKLIGFQQKRMSFDTLPGVLQEAIEQFSAMLKNPKSRLTDESKIGLISVVCDTFMRYPIAGETHVRQFLEEQFAPLPVVPLEHVRERTLGI